MDQRVFYTLTNVKGLEGYRTAKVLSLLIARLSDEGHLSEEQIDALLFECVRV